MKKPGVLTVISGFSGAGKGTVVKKLLKMNDHYSLSISSTTRAPRNGEVDGESYHFITKAAFEKMIEDDELFEWATYVNNYYGTPKRYVFDQLEKGQNIILEIELQGAMKVRKLYPGSIMIFIVPPSIKELKERLVGRGTESMENIIKRLRRAEEETAYIKDYDYIVENDILEECANTVNSIVIAEQHHAAYYGGIEQVLESQFNEVLKGE